MANYVAEPFYDAVSVFRTAVPFTEQESLKMFW